MSSQNNTPTIVLLYIFTMLEIRRSAIGHPVLQGMYQAKHETQIPKREKDNICRIVLRFQEFENLFLANLGAIPILDPSLWPL